MCLFILLSVLFFVQPIVKVFYTVLNVCLWAQIGKQLSTLANVDNEENLAIMKQYQGDAQHHDSITGTAKQVVDFDYTASLAFGQTRTEEAINVAYAKMMSLDPTTPSPVQNYCRFLNVTYCDVTETQNSFAVTVYNPLGHAFSSHVRLPVLSKSYIVSSPDGKRVPSQIVPIPKPVLNNPQKLGNAFNELVFGVHLEPLGFCTYFVEKPKDSWKGRARSKITAQSPQIADLSISNNLVKVTVDGKTGLLSSIVDLVAKRTYNIRQNFYYYDGMSGNNSKFELRASGAYIFRPNDTSAKPVGQSATATLIMGNVVQEIQQTFNDYVSQVIRLYPGEFGVELEWLVGPIPVSDGIGKEIISRFETDLDSDGLFYTDSNGREVLRRKRNFRPTWKLNITEPIAGNYYPVNSRIFIKDVERDAQFTVVTDRSQGGSSLLDGQLELMVHRRLLYDDAFGVDEALNEPGVDGKGLRVRGKHTLLVSSIKNAAVLHRIVAQKVHNPPFVSIAPLTGGSAEWRQNFRTLYSGLATALPDNMHVLTLEQWKAGTVLIRLEHFLEKSDDPSGLSKSATIDLKNLFASFTINELAETTLGANQWLKDKKRFTWKTRPGSFRNKEDYRLNTLPNELMDSLVVNLQPMQIRTFVAKVSYH